jgi:diacylglycerol kinase family enzyme
VQRIERIEELIGDLLTHSDLYREGRLFADVIVNPCAGSLSTDARCERTIERLEVLRRGLLGDARPRDSLTIRFHHTHYVGHARELSQSILRHRPPGVQLILSVGGDGTHGEVLSAYRGERETRFLRLPMGTGNDGADSRELGRAVTTLLGHAMERNDGWVEVKPQGIPPILGFNIASIGLDAYVAYLTNRLKGKFGGDLYKVIADVMTLFYEMIVGAGMMQVDVTGPDGTIETLDGRFLICAVGASGHREYGGGKQVMPGEENVCIIDACGLLAKIRLKSLFYNGDHTAESNVYMRSARSVVVRYAQRIPLQVDGETVWLRQENFPLSITVMEPTMPVLKPASAR